MKTMTGMAMKLALVAAATVGAALVPAAANAQVAFGVQIGHPGYLRPVPSLPYRPLPPDRFDYRHDGFYRDQVWQRDRDRRFYDDHRFDDRGRFDRDRRW